MDSCSSTSPDTNTHTHSCLVDGCRTLYFRERGSRCHGHRARDSDTNFEVGGGVESATVTDQLLKNVFQNSPNLTKRLVLNLGAYRALG